MKVVGAKLFEPAASALRRFGAFDGCLYLVNAAFARLTGGRIRLLRYHFVAQPLDVPMALPRRLGASYTTRQIAQTDADAAHFPRPAHVIADRYAQGSVCIAVYQNDTFIGFIWLVTGAYQEDEVKCRVLPQPTGQTAWDYDLYIEPRFRGSVAFVRLWSAAIEHMRARGIGWSLSRISAFSPDSRAAHRRMGALSLGSAIFLRILGVQVMAATVRPYLHVCWGDRPGPDLPLRIGTRPQ